MKSVQISFDPGRVEDTDPTMRIIGTVNEIDEPYEELFERLLVGSYFNPRCDYLAHRIPDEKAARLAEKINSLQGYKAKIVDSDSCKLRPFVVKS